MGSKRTERRAREPVTLARADAADTPRPVQGPAGSPPARVVVVEHEQQPLSRCHAARAVLASVAATVALIVRRRVRQPSTHIGWCLRFADGSSARVYRETMLERGPTGSPAVLVVEFRLRWVRGAAHACFHVESILHTPLFIGFAGFVRKLWVAHDLRGAYRGVYEWDGPASAHAYARALWRVLALVSVPGSIHYVVLPGLRLDDVLADPGILPPAEPGESWWRLAGVEPVAS